MPVYVIAQTDAAEPEAVADYRERVPEVIAQYGGTYVVRGGDSETLEGAWDPERVIVLRFDDREAARRWYDSPEYRELRELRQSSSDTDMILVDGVG
jgi:uncharacterized protein (DUF1330 family)